MSRVRHLKHNRSYQGVDVFYKSLVVRMSSLTLGQTDRTNYGLIRDPVGMSEAYQIWRMS